MRQRQIITVLAAALMVAPVAAATWYSHGTYEPDTIYDTQDVLMWEDEDTSTDEKRAYFNAYPTEFATSTNPNVGALGTRQLVPGFRYYQAVFGVWKDCNGDGYLGMAESSLVAYRATLLTPFGTNICPEGSMWNDGVWVQEYLAIGPERTDSAGNSIHPTTLRDPDALVWGDHGLPGAGAAATCPIAPPPHGTTAGTGWMIRYFDCHLVGQITGNVNFLAETTGLPIGFEDPKNPHLSNSPLNQHFPESLFGNPATGETGALHLDSEEDGGDEEAAFRMWDCSGDRTGVRDPTSESGRGSASGIAVEDGGAVSGRYGKIDYNVTDRDGYYVWFAKPDPKAGDPRHSWADGLNDTFRGFHVGGEDDGRDDDIGRATPAEGTVDPEVGGDCDLEGDDEDGDNSYSEVHQLAFFYADGANEGGQQVAAKKETDIDFSFDDGNEVSEFAALGENTPGHLGLQALEFWQGPVWQAGVIYVTPPQFVSRSGAIYPAVYVSFYAKFGSASTGAGISSPGGSQKYGSEACGSNTSGVHGGWECDPNNWWKDSTGKDTRKDTCTIFCAVPGMSYQFRDVDCDDGTVLRGSGLRASAVDLTGTWCEDAPAHVDQH